MELGSEAMGKIEPEIGLQKGIIDILPSLIFLFFLYNVGVLAQI